MGEREGELDADFISFFPPKPLRQSLMRSLDIN